MFQTSFDSPVPTGKNQCSSLFYRLTEHERLIMSRDIVTNYVKHKLTGFKIRRMQGNGLCILHAFVEGIFHLREVHKSI